MPDLDALSQRLGTTLEYLLCGVFQLEALATRYWVDGVLIDTATLDSGVVLLRGRVWCADHTTQWQVPTEVTFWFADERSPESMSVRVLVGNAAFATLGAHRRRNIVRRPPQAWLHAFEIEQGVARCVSPDAEW